MKANHQRDLKPCFWHNSKTKDSFRSVFQKKKRKKTTEYFPKFEPSESAGIAFWLQSSPETERPPFKDRSPYSVAIFNYSSCLALKNVTTKQFHLTADMMEKLWRCFVVPATLLKRHVKETVGCERNPG